MSNDQTPARHPDAALRIVVVEPRCLNRRLLVDWLQQAWPRAGIEAEATPEAVAADRLPIDLAIFGLGHDGPAMPRVSASIRGLLRRIGAAPLVVIGEREELAVVAEALTIGARGYIPTSFDPPTVILAIKFVLAGGTFVPARALAEAGRSARGGAERRPLGGDPGLSLTPRERDVAAGICAGKPNKIIAHELQISEATVKVFVRRILQKLGVTNRTEAASAIRHRFEEAGQPPFGALRQANGEASREVVGRSN